jgi:hypothetical protein
MKMPKLSRRRLLLLPLLSWPSLAQADAFPLAKLMASLAAVPERHATFREERHLAALTVPLYSRGTLFYRRPGYIEKVTDWPQPERLVVNGRWLTLTEGHTPPRVIDLRSQPELGTLIDALRAPLTGNLAALQARFTIQAAGTLASWALVLVPRDARAQHLLRWVQLTGQGATVTGVQLQQANGDEQVMQIGPSS